MTDQQTARALQRKAAAPIAAFAFISIVLLGAIAAVWLQIGG